MPPAFVDRPILPDHLKIPYSCYNRLRKLTIEAGVIGFAEAMDYFQRLGIDDIDLQLHYYDVVRALDTERIIHMAERRKQEQEKQQ